ncbi:MAG: response regulator transcription factor [Apibacter sp.]|jgi:DNA-binding response OmpR family regulator|uniref:DNA-binding response regulator, OmpR family, contains REC and winged-helix (WHTH) domain n=1 Tax=Apibacter mensalis TaxID=1586267 RepID=A0A0X3AMC9_9FLAO|nr:response regulator transcription factor [Apibacter mensalis]MCO6564810.1 response regulator transcription factor [Apibacter sp.]CVK15195.1 DNA-binding response regulator, OmpR family, contains REC and winged-helix (wHTH) domain [Apibacter mensalis]
MNILLVEDDLRVSELIKKGLNEQGFNVTLAYDGLSAKNVFRNNEFDLLITDIILPKISGIDLCKIIRTLKPEFPIIILTALGTTDDKIEGFEAGADDYLVKPFEMRELIARIKAILKRVSKNKSGYILKFCDLEMNLQTKIVKRSDQELNLTLKEFKLLEFLLKNQGRVISRTEIAQKVWNTHFDTGTNFIDVYINYLRKKVDKEFENKLIHTRSGMGFILKSDK